MRVRGEAWLRLVAVLAVVGIYATSFFLPALAIPVLDQPAADRLKAEVAGRAGGEVVSVEGPTALVILGYQAFRGGPSGGWALTAAWCANPVLWVGCLLMAAGRWRGAAFAGGVALVLGLAMVLATVIDHTAADVRWSAADYRAGYWLWLGSMALLLLTALTGRCMRRRQQPGVAGPNQALHLIPAHWAFRVTTGTFRGNLLRNRDFRHFRVASTL